MRLLLSGGSHRATLGSIGAIGYFLWSEATTPPGSGRTDRWSDVDEVVSVSGGSLLNAALATGTAGDGTTGNSTIAQLASVRRRLVADGLLPHRTARRLVVAIAILAVVGVAGWLVLAALGVVGPDVLGRSPWAFVVGIAVFPAFVGVERRLVGRYQRDVIDQIVGSTVTPIERVTSSRRHIICASGLASGLPYYFVMGGADRFEPAYGAALADGFTTADAAAASMALPGLGRVRAPDRYRREVLVDGGVSGGFGEQVTTTIERRPEDTWRSDGEWFAVDAVRHMTSNSRAAQLLQSISMLSLLGRWLKVSLEATYVNDLIDLRPGQYARVWSPNVLPPRPATPSAAVFRDGSVVDPAEGSHAPVSDPATETLRRRLGELQSQVAEMGLFSLRQPTIDLGIVVGFVSTLEVRGTLDAESIRSGLSWLDAELRAEGQLVAVWSGNASATDVRNDATSASADD